MHTDLHGDQFLIGTDGRVRVLDWSFPAAGARWVDTAFLILRLIEAGHPPAKAEAWASKQPPFSTVDDRTLTAFASYIAGMWTYWAAHGLAAPGGDHRARLARDYATWRLGLAGVGGVR